MENIFKNLMTGRRFARKTCEEMSTIKPLPDSIPVNGELILQTCEEMSAIKPLPDSIPVNGKLILQTCEGILPDSIPVNGELILQTCKEMGAFGPMKAVVVVDKDALFRESLCEFKRIHNFPPGMPFAEEVIEVIKEVFPPIEPLPAGYAIGKEGLIKVPENEEE